MTFLPMMFRGLAVPFCMQLRLVSTFMSIAAKARFRGSSENRLVFIDAKRDRSGIVSMCRSRFSMAPSRPTTMFQCSSRKRGSKHCLRAGESFLSESNDALKNSIREKANYVDDDEPLIE